MAAYILIGKTFDREKYGNIFGDSFQFPEFY